jgi:hypothetical protein
VSAQSHFGKGDVVGLLLDCDAGTLTVKKNGGERRGTAELRGAGQPTELPWSSCVPPGPLCWAASMYGTGNAVHVK